MLVLTVLLEEDDCHAHFKGQFNDDHGLRKKEDLLSKVTCHVQSEQISLHRLTVVRVVNLQSDDP